MPGGERLKKEKLPRPPRFCGLSFASIVLLEPPLYILGHADVEAVMFCTFQHINKEHGKKILFVFQARCSLPARPAGASQAGRQVSPELRLPAVTVR